MNRSRKKKDDVGADAAEQQDMMSAAAELMEGVVAFERRGRVAALDPVEDEEPVNGVADTREPATSEASQSKAGGFASRASFAAWCEESINSRDWAEAIQRWRQFRQVYPNDVWGFVKEAMALANVGAIAPAMQILATALQQFPDSEAVDLGFAEIAMLQGDYERAAAYWEKLRAQHPELPWGYNGAAEMLLETGQPAQAERLIEDALAAFPEDSTALVNYARCAQQRDEPAQALSRWRKLATLHPLIVWGHIGEAEALIALGRIEEARATIGLIGEKFPQTAGAHIERLVAEIIRLARQPVPIVAPTVRAPTAPEEAPAAGSAAAPPAAAKSAARSIAGTNVERDYARIMDDWFDPGFYLATNPDLRGIDPVEHFHHFGWKENRDPSPDFCIDHYLSAYPDARSAGINPLVYHLLVGQLLGHVPAKSPAVPIPPSVEVDVKRVPFDPSAITVADAQMRRFAFTADRLLAPTSPRFDPAALEIHWVIPDFTPGAGGHMNIFRICNHLEASGHKLTLWIRDPSFHHDAAAVRKTLHRHFQPLAAAIRFADDAIGDAAGDIIVATDAATVPLACSAWRFKRRFYFVQDFEAAFFPVGSRYFLAESTYWRDLDCICCGPWLERLMVEKYGRWARKFWQAADRTVYLPREQREGRATGRVAFYCRSFTDRRAVELGLLALEILARREVAFHVDFFGQEEPPFEAVPYAATNHGICDARALAQIYHGADIGIVFSATNYSIVPQEMMACRLPVLELDVESTRAVHDPEAVRLVTPEPQAIADAIQSMLADPEGRRAQADRAEAWVNQFSWDASARLVETAFVERLAELAFTPAKPAIARSDEVFATVVIPTLDGGELLRRVVDRVRSQRAPGKVQLLCIDSASTDGTQEYLAAHPEVDLLPIERADFQHGRTRNLGVAEAKGEFVAFLTQDALPVDDCWLYNLVCSLSANPRAGGVFGRHAPYPEVSEFIKRDIVNHFAGFDDLPVCVSLDDPKIRKLFAEIAGRQKLHYYSDNNSCLRKSVWQAVPIPEIEFGEDQMFALELLKSGYGKAYARQAVVYHSHDDAPEIVEERSYTEAKFFYQHFGYRLVRSKSDAARSVEGLNQQDRAYARQCAVPPDQLARRLAQNQARLDGYLRAMHECGLVQ